MSRKPITMLNELHALVDGVSGVPVGNRAATPAAKPQQAAPAALVLPAPRNGVYYVQDELVAALGITRGAMHSWIGRGLKVGGKHVKLKTLRAPKGGVPVGAVAEFFRRVNGVKVEIE